jgi:hypothetical protein
MNGMSSLGLAVLAVLLCAPSARSQQAKPDTLSDAATQRVPGTCAAGYPACRGGCEPGRLIFLPCMAVGAPNMAACREREVASCLRACTSRHCSRAVLGVGERQAHPVNVAPAPRSAR